jgi:hypothetical protein
MSSADKYGFQQLHLSAKMTDLSGKRINSAAGRTSTESQSRRCGRPGQDARVIHAGCCCWKKRFPRAGWQSRIDADAKGSSSTHQIPVNRNGAAREGLCYVPDSSCMMSNKILMSIVSLLEIVKMYSEEVVHVELSLTPCPTGLAHTFPDGERSASA